MVGDPVGDFIIRLKNAGAVKKETVVLPFSELKFAIAKKLSQHGYIGEVEKQGKKEKKNLAVTLLYKADGDPRITDVKRISKPGRRLYSGARELMPIKHGHGLLILSTPKGILTGVEAKKEKVGGETLFSIW